MPDYGQPGSPELGRGADEIRRAELAPIFWQAREALDVLNAKNADPGDRAKAACHWASLYHFVHSPRDETDEERAARLVFLERLAAEAGVAPLLFYLREFALDIAHAILASSDPINAAATIFRDPPREGNPGRPFNECIAMAVDVQKKRWLEGMTLENACGEVAEKTRDPRIGSDAVRRIYENVKKEKKAVALMGVIAAGQVMDAAAADPLIRDSAIICPRCDYENMMRDLRRLRASSRPEK
jgi:hypothetical protein